MREKIGLQKLSRFFRCLSLMINCGIPILDAVSQFSDDNSIVFSEVVSDVSRRLMAGASLSEALRAHPSVFPRFCVNLIRAGEHSGSMQISLVQLSDHLERADSLQRRLWATMTYPLLILVLMFVMVLCMVWFVFPREVALLESLGAEMPWATQVLIDTLTIFFHPVTLLVGLVCCVVTVVLLSNQHDSRPLDFLRKKFDTAILDVPILGSFFKKMAAARTLSALSSLLEAGETLDRSLTYASSLLGNVELEQRMAAARKDLRNGHDFSETISANMVFPVLAVQMLKVAEESGGMPRMTRRVSQMFAREVEDSIDTAASLVEPIMFTILGFFVGFLLLATLLPTVNIMGTL